MLEPLELQVFPSCYNCLSCSDDGEIALATGEHVQILTPKTATNEDDDPASTQGSSGVWQTTRFKVNIFTTKEWPIIFPQSRDQFSLGAEQSTSSVVGLSWSPPGIAKYRRCILAVLTSNLVLSFFEAVGAKGKWTRIGIANKTLENYFEATPEFANSPRLRKTNIRSFAWNPPLKVPSAEPDTSLSNPPGVESRWGFFTLTVANDDNDIIVLQVNPSGIKGNAAEPMDFEVLSVTPLDDISRSYHNIQPNSIFASAIQSQTRILSLASGPWLYYSSGAGSDNQQVCSATTNVAAVFGTNLKVIKINVIVRLQHQGTDQTFFHQLLSSTAEDSMLYAESQESYHFTGPVQWVHKIGSNKLLIAAGVLGGVGMLSLSEDVYKGEQSHPEQRLFHYYPFFESTIENKGGNERPHFERMSAMTVAFDNESSMPTLHMCTIGGYTAMKSLSNTEYLSPPSPPPWKNQIDSLRERFDIDRDLGGLTVSRIWGLTSAYGLLAAAVTMHPGDMVEYRTNAEERTVILFSMLDEQSGQSQTSPFQPSSPNRSAEFLRDRRNKILHYILHTIDNNNNKQLLSPKILYTSACCAIVESQNAELQSQACRVLEKLGTTMGVDLSDEIAKCSTSGNSIDQKSAKELSGSGSDIFEICDICDTGISWYSAQEAQCATGHLFVRCGLTFLAIQEPGTSKFCSICKTEYLDESLLDPSSVGFQQSCRTLSDVFDTCIYCNAKFRA